MDRHERSFVRAEMIMNGDEIMELTMRVETRFRGYFGDTK